MAKLLVCLVPWMVMTAAYAETMAPASVVYTFSEKAISDGVRQDDELWMPLSAIPQLGWRGRATDESMDIEAEGRLIRVPRKVIDRTERFSITEAARQLGAATVWDGSTLRILGQVRSLDFIQSSVRVDSTLPFLVRMSQLSGPNRLVIDLVGATLPVPNTFRFPKNVRVGQFKSDTLRLVIDDPAITLPRTTRPGSTRWLNMSLAPFRFEETIVVEPPFQTVPVEPLPSPPLQPGDMQAQPNSATTIQPVPSALLPTLQSASVRTVNPRSDVIELRSSGSVRPQPTVTYESATELTMNLNATLAPNLRFDAINSELVEEVSRMDSQSGTVRLRIRTKRPVVFELSAASTLISLRLTVPKNSDGRLSGKTVVIDPGHGGADSGAIWPQRSSAPSVMEKVLALAVSRYLASKLTEAGVNVILTRNSDVRIPLKDRAEIANRNRADVFVSVHFNSSSVANRKSGNMTFYHMRDPEGMLLARCIQDEIAKVSGLPTHGIWSDSRIYNSGFAVLRNSDVPAVLLELGFINHERDRAAMVRNEWQQRIADAVAKGIKVYLGDVKETSKP